MVSKIKAVLDACVLHPFHLRNLFLQLAVDDVIDVFWSDEISREWLKSVSTKISTTTVDRLHAQLAKMNEILPEANVHGWEPRVDDIRGLPDEDDRHVVAVAIPVTAEYIITWNMPDFPATALAPHHVIAINPDDFLVKLLQTDAELVIAVVERARQNLTKSSPDMDSYLNILANQKVTRFVEQLRALMEGASGSLPSAAR